ncbi:DMT family transporter [Martelella alba]|uniref:DMT family transporter n=2 Tax=Martelella alba TaxID=2590451 RepID=A0A506U3S1_9HYPH|nr:DMT family transporter [Martelella alba]
MRISTNIQGAIFMILAMACFAANDATVKLLTKEIGIGQIMFFRGMFIVLLALAIAWRAGVLGSVRNVFQPKIVIRSFCELVAAVTYLEALRLMPLANASAIQQSLPLAVTLGAALFMGEPVGWRRWSAILVGFIGVLIIIRPGPDGFDTGAIFVIMAVFGAATRDLMTKTITASVPAIVITLSTALLLTAGGGVIGTIEADWSMLTVPILLKLVLAAAFLLGGYQSIVVAVRKADISYIAPFRYTGLLWAALLGMIVFANYPDAHVLTGGAVIVAAGLYSFHRERKRGIAPLAETTQPGPSEGGGLIVRAQEEASEK